MPHSSQQVLGKGMKNKPIIFWQNKHQKADATADKTGGRWFSSTVCGPFQVVCKLKHYFHNNAKMAFVFFGVDISIDGTKTMMRNTAGSLDSIKAAGPIYTRSHGFCPTSCTGRGGGGGMGLLFYLKIISFKDSSPLFIQTWVFGRYIFSNIYEQSLSLKLGKQLTVFVAKDKIWVFKQNSDFLKTTCHHKLPNT